MSKKVIISILVNPLSTKTKLEYLIKNINNGLAKFDYDYTVTLELVTWWATKIEDDLLGSILYKLHDNYPIKTKKLNKLIEDKIQPELKNQINDNKIIFDNIDGTSYKNISNIKCNHSFHDVYNFKGYGAVHQFELLHEHIKNNINYDYYLFFSSNFLIVDKETISSYIAKLEKYDVPFNTMINLLDYDEDQPLNETEYVKLKHGNLNSFGCRPVDLLDFFDNKLSEVFNSVSYENNGEKVTIASSFANWGGNCIKNYKHRIRDNYEIKKIDLLDTTIFPFDDGKWEPAIQFPMFLLLYCIRYNETYNTPLVWSDNFQMKLPEYCLEKVENSKYNTSRRISHRYDFLWEPYSNQIKIYDIISEIEDDLKIKYDIDVPNQLNKKLNLLIKYFDEKTYSDNLKIPYGIWQPMDEGVLDKTILNTTFRDHHQLLVSRFFNSILNHFN